MAKPVEFKYAPMFQVGEDKTEYRLLTKEGISTGEFEGKGIYLVGICANVEVKVRSAGVYDSFTRSSYGAEDRSFLAKRLQTFSLLRLNDYGMPCANDAEKRISESYTCAGYTCSKRLLPLPDSSLPAFVVENDRGTARAVNYSELSG